MLKLTKKADYGLIALRHLVACSQAGGASAKEIADQYGIPLPLLSKILQKLARNGFLRSEQGIRGGYRLARDPRQISALQVVRTLDGPVILTSCFSGQKECGHSARCSVRKPLRKVHEGILRLLDSVSLWDLSRDEEETETAGKVVILAH